MYPNILNLHILIICFERVLYQKIRIPGTYTITFFYCNVYSIHDPSEVQEITGKAIRSTLQYNISLDNEHRIMIIINNITVEKDSTAS